MKTKIINKIRQMSSLAHLTVSLSISLVVMAMSGIVAEQLVLTRADSQFTKDSQQITDTLNNSLIRYSDLLLGMHSFMLSNNNVNQRQFDKYTESLYLSSQYPAIHMLDFAEHVREPQLKQFYSDLNKEYAENEPTLYNDRIKNALKDNEDNVSKEFNHYIVKYATPLNNTYPYIGMDLSNNLAIVKQIKEGLGTREINSSGKIFISKKGNEYPFVTLRLAHFTNEIYAGSIGASIRLDKTLFGNLNTNLNYIEFQIFSSEEEGKTLIYDSRYDRKTMDVFWPKVLFNEKRNKFTNEHTFKIGKRDFFIKTFSTTIPPNVADMSLVIIISLSLFFISFAIIYFGIFQRIKRKELNEKNEERTSKLQIQATTDELTGLFNRRAFFVDLEERIQKYKLENSQEVHKDMFLFFIDLDGFKRVNDTLGHSAGDIVLKEYAARLKLFAKIMPCSYYRIGGDEFTVFVENNLTDNKPINLSDIENFAKSLLSLTDSPFQVKDEEFLLSQSIGIAEYPSDGTTPEELFKNSDMAMYEAKHSGKNCYLFFSQNFSKELEQRNQILNLLNSAIDKKEFHVEFQPKMRKDNGVYKIKGVETLLRWNNAKLGSVSPALFIPLAEEAGFMNDIGIWLINQVAKTIHGWKRTGMPDINVAINISAKQFNNDNLPDYYASVLDQYAINPNMITIEITESAMMKEPGKTKEILNRFRNYGFGVSVDDFGTGHSSLSYLRQFPVTEIKIDKSFTDEILIDEHDKIIVEGIISMSQKLKLDVVIEGVETIEQVNWLEQQTVDGNGVKIQGYYFSKPLKEDVLKEFIQKFK